MKMFQFTQEVEKRVLVEYYATFTREDLEEWLSDSDLGTIEEIRAMSDAKLAQLFADSYEEATGTSLAEIADDEEERDSETTDQYKIDCRMFDSDGDADEENE